MGRFKMVLFQEIFLSINLSIFDANAVRKCVGVCQKHVSQFIHIFVYQNTLIGNIQTFY